MSNKLLATDAQMKQCVFSILTYFKVFLNSTAIYIALELFAT
jgi:hypothetical protein